MGRHNSSRRESTREERAVSLLAIKMQGTIRGEGGAEELAM